MFQSEGGGAFKGFKGFSMAMPSTPPSSSLTGFSGFGGTGSFKGFGGMSNGTGSTPSFGGFPAAAKAGEESCRYRSNTECLIFNKQSAVIRVDAPRVSDYHHVGKIMLDE